MTLADVLGTALWSLSRSRTRTGLTMLGIIIGVAAVVSVVSLGQGAIANTEADISAMGINLVTVSPGAKMSGGFRTTGVTTLVPDDALAIRSECPAVANVSEGVKTTAQAIYQQKNASTTVEGGSDEYPLVRGWRLASGGFFGPEQVRQAAKVCVIGELIREKLFGSDEPIGRILRVNRVPLEVIGVFAPKGQTSSGQDQDDVVVVPWTTGLRRIIGAKHLNSVLLSARSAEQVPKAVEQVTSLLERRHRIPPGGENDFSCQTQREVAEAQEAATLLMMTLVSVVALIALFVGGVGVMNIMLVSVLERTREIGIRMAIGARSRAVMWQFLGETVVLTSLGGLIGAALGIGVAHLIPVAIGWPTRVTAAPVVVSFLFSAAVGLFFGLYPAYQASKMDPIEALRYE